ncbi:MAG: efflux RND transporter periplasmic adaptor subunit [Bacteroidota bacterium]
MKKYIVYIILLLAGILIGKFALSGEVTKATVEDAASTAETTLWTCSMHPQIMQPEPGDCPLCGMDLIPAQESSTELTSNQFRMTENALALGNIETTKVSETNAASASLKLTGTIEANEKTNATQTAHFAGRIEKLFVNFTGERVRKGQKIALVYSPELVTTQQELLTAMRMKTSQPALYKAVRNKLKLWKLTEKQIQQIESSQQVASQFPIYASVSGVVTEKLVEEGNHVMEGGAMFKVSNLTTVWASFDAYENQLGSLQEGDAITIRTNANLTEEISAKITFIDPVVNPNTRTVAVKVALNNADNRLKPGMFVTGILKKATSKSTAMTIPASAVLWTGKRSLVYVKANNASVFEAREIVLGMKKGAQYEVLSGLNADEEIVTNGTFTVDAAAQLQGKKSMMHQTTSTQKEKTANIEAETLTIDSTIEKAFQPSIKAYVALKDALVQSDSVSAVSKAADFRNALEQLSIPQRIQLKHFWAIPHKTSKRINAYVTLEKQRQSFEIISKTMIELLQQFNYFENVLYVQYCPMANNDKGANWLSFEKEIKNPYFGDMMLTCGNVERTLGVGN